MKLDRSFYARLLALAVPIIIQNFISSSLNLFDVLMIGQLGEVTVAAVGLSNQIFFLLMFLLFGISSGAGVFTAQLWGKGDVPSIHRVMGISLAMGLTGSLFFSFMAIVLPQVSLSIYTNDPAVIQAGLGYLRLSGLSYPMTAISFTYAATLRSTGNTRPPMFVSAITISLKTLLNYLLIFGHLGLPAMGIQGAALSTVIARTLECLLLLGYTYLRRAPTAAPLHRLIAFQRSFVVNFLKIAFPVVINEMLWSLGISTYNAIYAHISTEAAAAIQIAGTIENLAFVIFIGISDATGILVGNKIGAQEQDTAYTYARRSLTLGAGGAMLIGACIYLLSGNILSLYKVSPEVLDYARRILLVMAFVLWIRVSNMTAIVGILRSGGDTRFSMFLDGGTMWVVGVPSALLAAFVFHLPVYWVYLVIMSEELVKFSVSLWRFRSRRWIHNISQTVPA